MIEKPAGCASSIGTGNDFVSPCCTVAGVEAVKTNSASSSKSFAAVLPALCATGFSDWVGTARTRFQRLSKAGCALVSFQCMALWVLPNDSYLVLNDQLRHCAEAWETIRSPRPPM